MISREYAEGILKQLEYERLDVAPSWEAYRKGVYIPVYFAVGPRRWYPYGDNIVDGWIAPQVDLTSPRAVARGIGYCGTVELFVPHTN